MSYNGIARGVSLNTKICFPYRHLKLIDISLLQLFMTHNKRQVICSELVFTFYVGKFFQFCILILIDFDIRNNVLAFRDYTLLFRSSQQISHSVDANGSSNLLVIK